MESNDRKEKRVFYSYLAVFLIIGAFIAIAGFQYHRNFERNYRTNVENQLSLIADLKVGELEHWLEEQRSDAETIFGNEVFSGLTKRYLNNTDDHDSKRKIEMWMQEFQTGFKYDAVFLTDLQLNRKINISKETELPTSNIAPKDIDSLKSGKLVFTDFYWGKFKQKIFLKILVPILDAQQLIGIIELRIDPKKYLFPILANWPIPSETSETVILRRDGNEAVYLNELRFQKNSALNLRVPIQDTSFPAARAVLGDEGHMEGMGYRGKTVVAHVHKVPNSTWYLVAQTDKSEIYAPLRKDTWLTMMFSFGIFLISGLGLGFVWRYQRTLVYKQKIESAEALLENEERFRRLFDESTDPILILDETGFTDCNQSTVSILKYSSKAEFLNKSPWELSPERQPDGLLSSEKAKIMIDNAISEGYNQFEWIHTKSDGSELPVEVMLTPIQIKGKQVIYTMWRDITTRNKTNLEREVIHEIIQGVTTTDNLNELLKLIHQSLAKVVYADNIFVALFDQNTKLFSFPYWVDQFDSIPEPDAMRKSLSNYVFRTGKPFLFTPDSFELLKEQNEVELVGSYSPSWVGVPLHTPTATIGVLVLQHYEKENVYSERDVQFLDSVGSQIALAIERKLNEEAIKKEMDFSQRSINSLPGLFYLFNQQGKFLRWNRNFENMTGYSAEEVANLSPLDLFDEPDKTAVMESIQQVFQIGEATVEADLISKDKTKTSFFFTGKQFQFDDKLCLVGMGIDISDRKQAEEALRNERLLLRTVIDNIPDSIYSKDTGYRKTLANLTELSYSGVTTEAEILGKTDFDLYPKELAEGFFADDQLVLQAGQTVLNREEYVIDSKGKKHWLLTSKIPLKDKYENITGLVGIGRDITSRRQTEEDLRESEIKLNVILQSTADGILAVDGNGKVIKTNKRFAELWRIPQALIDSGDDNALIGFVLEQLANPDEFISKVQKLYHSTDEDLDHLHFKDGRTFERFSAPMVMDDSSIGRVWSFRDVTERRQAEEALRTSQQLIEGIINAIPVRIFWKDKDLVYLGCNTIFARDAGFSDPKDMIGKDDFQMGWSDQAELYRSGDRQVIESGNNLLHNEEPQTTPEGNTIILLTSKIPLKNSLGEIYGILGTSMDITDRKRAEDEVKLKNEELSKSNAEKDKFFSIIAHDLRGPFSGFLGLTQVMAEELTSLTMSQIQELAGSMKNSATNLYSLLENLLKWAQMQRGLIPFAPEVIQLQPLVDECLAPALEPARNKGIDINFSIPDNTAVFTDSNMLQTVIRNLVSNAVKFTPKGGKVSLSVKANSDKSVEISVQDTGIGMSKAIVDNLFRPDVQTSRKGTGGEPSTGLGLLLCKEFIEKHGGKIWVESEEGKGSTFYFTLAAMIGNNSGAD